MSELTRDVEGHVSFLSSDAVFAVVCVTCGKLLAEFPDISGPTAAVFALMDHPYDFSEPHTLVVVNTGDNTCLSYPKIPETIHFH